VFWPGAVLPLLALVLVLGWPWIDARLSGDRAYHDVLVPPSTAPWRVGAGAALIAAGVVLTLAATDDEQARALHVPVETLVWVYRLAFAFGSIAVGAIAAMFAYQVRVRRNLHGPEAERVIFIKRNERGGFDEENVTRA
jgi:ubiquinol-cytochrome c reductase cytochrome b subunit